MPPDVEVVLTTEEADDLAQVTDPIQAGTSTSPFETAA
jgi:hypothetical protein